MLITVQADLFDFKGGTIGCTVNLVGVMGKGVAKQCAREFPGLFGLYRAALKANSLNAKGVCSVHESLVNPERQARYNVVCIPTKIHWRNDSPLDLIERSCFWLRDHLVQDYGFKTLYIPPLGAGNGGRDLVTEIMPILESAFSDSELEVVLCLKR